MKILHAVWAVASLGLAFLVNQVMRPEVDRSRDPGELAVGTGELVLEHSGGRMALALVTLRPIVRDLPFPFGKVVQIREVMVRSASGSGDPDVEIYFDLGGDAPFGVDERHPNLLVAKSFSALPTVFGGSETSRIRLDAATGYGEVVSGALTLTEALPVNEQAGETSVRIKGHLSVRISTAGVEDQVQGRLSGRWVW